jgi:hypothetical protein
LAFAVIFAFGFADIRGNAWRGAVIEGGVFEVVGGGIEWCLLPCDAPLAILPTLVAAKPGKRTTFDGTGAGAGSGTTCSGALDVSER